MNRRKNPVFLFLAVLLGLNVLAWLIVLELPGRELEVIFFDVGQGDATLIETPHGHHILIDGGRDSTILEKLGKEMPFFKRSIDLVILTHPHNDHVAGLVEVLKRYDVKNVLWTGILADSAVFQEWQKALQAENAQVYIAQAGQQVLAGSVVLDVFHPFESLENQKVQHIDNTSVVVKALFGENSFLFTGDAFGEVERELVKAGVDLRSNVLKVGHHGSRTSTAPEFVEAVFPEVAVISAGKDNVHGHPHPETLETLANYDILVFRTEEPGDIKIISNGKTYAVSVIQN